MGGHTPIRGPAPTRESFHLAIAREAFAHDRLTLEEHEASVEHVLRGGHLNAAGRIPAPGELPSLPDPEPREPSPPPRPARDLLKVTAARSLSAFVPAALITGPGWYAVAAALTAAALSVTAATAAALPTPE